MFTYSKEKCTIDTEKNSTDTTANKSMELGLLEKLLSYLINSFYGNHRVLKPDKVNF
jgi:hypothetical protein